VKGSDPPLREGTRGPLGRERREKYAHGDDEGMRNRTELMLIAALSVAAVILAGALLHGAGDTSVPSSDSRDPLYGPEDAVLTYRDGDTYLKYDGSEDLETLEGWYHSFSSGGTTYTVSLEMVYGDVTGYRDADVSRRYSEDTSETISYVTAGDPYVTDLVSQLMTLYGLDPGTEDASELLGYAEFVLDFSQSFTYETDRDFVLSNSVDLAGSPSDYYVTGDSGGYEYWKFPLETLYDRAGDCEDTSILYTALMSASGYDAAVVLLPGHCVSAVHIEEVSGGCYYYADGVKYYFCETTADSYTIGKSSMSDDGTVIPVPEEGEAAQEYVSRLYCAGYSPPFLDRGGWDWPERPGLTA